MGEIYTMNDTKILELLASKICHDLISPVGAISNGIEILEEMGADDNGEVTALISSSTTQANAKLKTLRMVYGLGGADETIRISDIHGLFGEFIENEKRLSQDWDPHHDFDLEYKPGRAKILLAALILISENLPKGGVLSVTNGEDNSVIINGKGEKANFQDDFTDIITHKTDEKLITPKHVHAYVTGLMAKNYGFEITASSPSEDFICLRLKSANVF